MPKTIKRHLPISDGWASTTLIERYEQQVCNILAALGDINEQYKYTLVTDRTSFEAFSYNTHKPVDKKALRKISKNLGVEISYDMTLVEVARKMFEKSLDCTLIK